LFYLFPIFSMNFVAFRLSDPLLYHYLLRSVFHSGKFNLFNPELFCFALTLPIKSQCRFCGVQR